MRRLPLAVTGLVAATLAVAGCGSSGDSSSSSGAAAPAAAAKPAPPVSGTTVRVSMKDIAFHAQDVTVKLGQTVTWTDREPVIHNVTADSGASFKSDNFGQGKSFSYKPTKPGLIRYECTIHPGMVGTLTVVR